jgi:hypothetical protein
MFTDLGIGINPEKLAIGFVEIDNISIRVRYDSAIVDIVKNQFQSVQLLPGVLFFKFRDTEPSGFFFHLCAIWFF